MNNCIEIIVYVSIKDYAIGQTSMYNVVGRFMTEFQLVRDRLKYIVFLEDDPLDFEVYSDLLSDHLNGVDIKQYDDVDEKFYSKYPPGHTLVLLDLNLSGTKGLDVYKYKLKSYHYTVYVHTSSDNPHDIKLCKKQGLTAYFQKKIGKDKIKDQLMTILNFYELNLINKFRD